jgi:hypothetical protein
LDTASGSRAVAETLPIGASWIGSSLCNSCLSRLLMAGIVPVAHVFRSILECVKRPVVIALLACLVAVAPARATIPTQPGPETVPPTDIATGTAEPSETSAVVLGYFNYGSTNPPGIAKDCWFDYGTTVALGTRQVAICSGTTKATLAPLQRGTTYYYRAGASNGAGTTYGPNIKSFTTLGTTPPAPPGPTPPGATSAELRVAAGQLIGSVLRRGLKLRVTLTGSCPCTVRGKLLVSRTTAKRFGIKRTQPLAQTRREYASPGTVKATLELGSQVKRKLRQARTLKATAQLTITGPSGTPIVVSRSLRLKRTR